MHDLGLLMVIKLHFYKKMTNGERYYEKLFHILFISMKSYALLLRFSIHIKKLYKAFSFSRAECWILTRLSVGFKVKRLKHRGQLKSSYLKISGNLHTVGGYVFDHLLLIHNLIFFLQIRV